MSDTDEFEAVRLRPRPSETVALSIPTDTLDLIRQVASSRDMSPEALLKFYIGQGLRRDAAQEHLAGTVSRVIGVDPEVMGGTPVFSGTRVPVKHLFDYLQGGHALDEFLDDFPSVTREQAVAALHAACEALPSNSHSEPVREGGLRAVAAAALD